MRVGMDFLRFSKEHNGGKCQVAYNLLKGFYENGYAESIICFCHEDLTKTLLDIAPDIKTVIVPDFKEKKIVPTRIMEGYCLGKLIKDEKIDVMFFLDKFSPIFKTRCKSVLIAHDILVFAKDENTDIEYEKGLIKKHKLLLRIDFALRDHIIAISEYDKKCMIKYLRKPKKIVRIYDPIVFPEYKKNDNKKYITALNIQHPHKNIMTLIKAYNEIKNKISYELILVGKEPHNIKEIKEYIKSNDLEGRVIITGFVTEEKLEDIISQTRLYINPSLFEGFGMASVEMMGNEIPTICADNSAQKEVTLGCARYYSPANDAHALAGVIQDELGKPADKKRLKEYANMVKEKYDYRVIASEYWDLFTNLANKVF